MSTPPPLLKIFIEPTCVCNLRCPGCYTGRHEIPPKKNMEYDDFCALIDQLPKSCIEIGLFNSGETLLHRDALKFIDYASHKCTDVFLSTNFNVDKKIVGKLAESGLSELIVSLDGLLDETYTKYRIGGDLNLVKNNIEHFIATRNEIGRGPSLTLQLLVSSYNEIEIPNFVEYASNCGADRAYLKSLNLRKFEELGHFLPKDDKYRRYSIDGKPKGLNEPCYWPDEGCAVLCDGTVQPCCAVAHDTSASLGNAFSDGLMNVWNSKIYDAFRTQMKKRRSSIPHCRSCVATATERVRVCFEQTI